MADAFAKLYEMENIVVIDAGRYGFVELKYYKPSHGFEDAITFTDILRKQRRYICNIVPVGKEQ